MGAGDEADGDTTSANVPAGTKVVTMRATLPDATDVFATRGNRAKLHPLQVVFQKTKTKQPKPIECEHYLAFQSKICDLDKGEGVEPCSHHKARPMAPNLGDIIVRPTYDTPDEAAMAAANIIKYHICKSYDNIEYGISIYENNVDGFCLVTTRQGYADEVFSDYKIHESRCPKGYRFVADVHSHPVCGTYGVHEFSYGDYILSCGGQHYSDGSARASVRPPHPKFLVGAPIAWSKGCGYEKGEIVAYGGNFWIAQEQISLNMANDAPHDMNFHWKEIRDFQKDPLGDYDVGEVVLDRNDPNTKKDRMWSFWKKVENAPWDQYHLVLWSRPWILTMFTPPSDNKDAKDNVDLVFEMRDEKRKGTAGMPEHEILKKRGLTEQRMNIVTEWDSTLKWEDKW